MIERLFIKNYLMIKEAEISFTKGLNILTGETGAGKSIILDALSLILGERADYSLIKKDQDKLVVEGHFRFNNNRLIKDFLAGILEEEITSDDIILRREIIKKGISRSFINDSPVNISDMKEFGDIVIDIHSQNEHQSLLNKETHIKILDSYINRKDIFSDYIREFGELRNLIRSHTILLSKRDELMKTKSYLEFQLSEINKVNPSEAEDIELENELKKLENVEDIALGLGTAIKVLYENEYNALSLISNAVKELKKIVRYDNTLDNILADLENSYILVKESSAALSSYHSGLSFDSGSIDHIRDRLNHMNSLKKKYNLNLSELIEKAKIVEKELMMVENFDYEIEELLKKIIKKKETVFTKANKLNSIRIKRSVELEENINSLFKDVGLESAQFKVMIKTNSADSQEEFSFKKEKEMVRLGETGFTDVEFFIRINKGADLSPLKKSASGGEISRIMLAIKTVLSEKDKIPILVFDEIDIGISGRIASKVGKILRALSVSHQIICITHLPQIAAMSDVHFHVSKRVLNEETIAEIKLLSKEEKVFEVAKLISGAEVTEAATNSARELINS